MAPGLKSAEKTCHGTSNRFGDPHSSRTRGRDLWAGAKTGKHQILLFSPEYTDSELGKFIDDQNARLRIGYFVIDEIHLVYYEWGPEFRPLYETLFTMCARLPDWTVFVGFTAKLEPGHETDSVVDKVGLAI